MQLNLTKAERAEFRTILRGWADAPVALQMQNYIQHGSVNTYEHCMSVAQTSFWLARRFGLAVDEVSMVRGALLHDFYLYDWHDCAHITRLHGFNHPAIALKNAERCYPLNDIERDVIRNHMWPLTLLHAPATREAAIVCFADKLCSTKETVLERRRKHANVREKIRAVQALQKAKT